MTASVIGGPVTQELDRDDDGNRTYMVTHRVKTTDVDDGPSVVMTASGLPSPGSFWQFGNDYDAWAFCTGFARVRKHQSVTEGSPTYHWTVQQKFATLNPQRCNTTTIDNPLLEPMKVSGSFVKYTKEVTQDKDGNPLENSAHEMLRGSIVEFDHNRPTVRIEQNVASLGLNVFAGMIDTVNDAPLWGLSARMAKLSNVSWERLYYGTCNVYYKRIFEFDVDFTTFDRVALDEGTMALGRLDKTTGLWDSTTDFAPGVPLDADNPIHFSRVKDIQGENKKVILNGAGVPVSDIASIGTIDIQYYGESNFLSLGIPTSF